MDKQQRRGLVMILFWLLATLVWWQGQEVQAAGQNWTVPPVAPVLLNGNMECSGPNAYVPGSNSLGQPMWIPGGWTLLSRNGIPQIGSTRYVYDRGNCDDDNSPFIERLEGLDSLVVRSQDIEVPPEPGKPFDFVLYQQVRATYGGAYSLSAWMISLCGNKSAPCDCPDDFYNAKSIGIDPNGGTDPDAPSVIWVENRKNFVNADGEREGWQNLTIGAKALTGTITIFARMEAPRQWHGSMGFMDAFSLVRAPLSALDPLSDTVDATLPLTLTWQGRQSEDIAAIGGTYALLYDVQVRPLPNSAWRDIAVGLTATSTTFTAPCIDTRYEFRVRARSEQPPAPPEGVFPNHRYPGIWTDPQQVLFATPMSAPISASPSLSRAISGTQQLFIPALLRPNTC